MDVGVLSKSKIDAYLKLDFKGKKYRIMGAESGMTLLKSLKTGKTYKVK